jgi:hypothetical protein
MAKPRAKRIESPVQRYQYTGSYRTSPRGYAGPGKSIFNGNLLQLEAGPDTL